MLLASTPSEDFVKRNYEQPNQKVKGESSIQQTKFNLEDYVGWTQNLNTE